MKTLHIFSTVAFVLASGTASAAGAGHSTSSEAANAQQPAMRVAQAGAGAATEGEVRKVDKENKKITLKHGEIKNLGMPGMTMVFQVKDPAMLDSVQSGDKVLFTAEKLDGAYVVTSIESTK